MEDTFEVDILDLIKKNLILLIVTTVVFGVAAFGASYLLPNEYTATTSMYILRQDQNEQAVAANTEELTYASTISNDVIAIMNSGTVRQDVSEKLGLASLAGYTASTTNETSSRLVTLSVTGKDPEMVALVANTIVEDTAERAVEIMNIQAINVIDPATPATAPSGPNHLRIAMIGAATGFALAFAIVFMREAADTRVRDGEEAAKLIGVPVVGHFAQVEG